MHGIRRVDPSQVTEAQRAEKRKKIAKYVAMRDDVLAMVCGEVGSLGAGCVADQVLHSGRTVAMTRKRLHSPGRFWKSIRNCILCRGC